MVGTIAGQSLGSTATGREAKRMTNEEWFHVIRERSPLDEKTVGVAVTINGRLEKIDWYGHVQVFRRLWPGLFRAAVLEALLEQRAQRSEPRPLDEARFRYLLLRLDTVKPQQERLSPQAGMTLGSSRIAGLNAPAISGLGR
jgi:hypothetical protein